MFSLLDVIAVKDDVTTCDFWREQPYVKLPDIDDLRPASYHLLSQPNALSGKKIGVPKMYIGGVDSDPRARAVHTRQSVINLWSRARKTIESVGAVVVEVDFPVVTIFDATDSQHAAEETSAPPHRNEVDMSQLMAYAWDDFLSANGDTKVATSLAQVDSATIFPRPPGALLDRYDQMDPLVRHKDVVAHITHDRPQTYDIPGLEQALRNLEERRKTDYEDWLVKEGLDAVVWPCNADVGKADSDTNEGSAAEAWRNGVLYSNGNCAIRQLGIPTVSVPMGVMADTRMPVNLTFAGKAYDDSALFQYAFAYEKATCLRQQPERTPALSTDSITITGSTRKLGDLPPRLTVDKVEVSDEGGSRMIHLSGTVDGENLSAMQVYLDGDEVNSVCVSNGVWSSDTRIAVDVEWPRVRVQEKRVPDLSKVMVIVLATGQNGRSAAEMVFV
ncbi:amidase signature enzyme, partial [Aureobasidium melanogenum]